MQQECAERLSHETKQLSKSLAETRDKRLEQLRYDHESDREGAEVEARMRAELELSRTIGAIRDECARDLSKVGVSPFERDQAQIGSVVEKEMRRMTGRIQECVKHVEDEGQRGREELVATLRREWKGLLEAHKLAIASCVQAVELTEKLRAAKPGSFCVKCADLEKKLKCAQVEDSSLRDDVRDLRARLDSLRARSAESGPRAPPPRTKPSGRNLADVGTQTFAEEAVRRPRNAMSRLLLPALFSQLKVIQPL